LDNLTSIEKVYVFGLIIIILFSIVKSMLSKNKIEIFSPIIFIGLIYTIYTVIGPMIFVNIDMKIFPKEFMRQFYEPAWRGSFYSLLFVLLELVTAVAVFPSLF